LGGKKLKYKLSSKDALRLTIIIIAFLAVFVSFTDNSTAATINVGSGAGNHSTIIPGDINSAQINDNGIVNDKGTPYKESISIEGNTGNANGVSKASAKTYTQSFNTNGPVIDPVDLVVTKDVETFEPVWNYNETQAFFITVSNYGPDDATLVKVEDLLPAGLIFDHAIVSTGVFDEPTMTWYIGDLVNGGYETLELFVNVTGHNTIVTNTVVATSFETELNPDDNTASVMVTIPAAAHVNLTKEYNNLQGNVITSSNYQQNFWAIIKANNIGPDSTDVILEDVLNSFPFIQFATDTFGENFYASFDNGVTWIPGSLSGINFQDLTAFGNFFITNMQPGDNVWLKVFLTTDFATGIVSNEATAYTSVYEYLTPGFASADLTVPPAADLFVIKWDDADYIGQTVYYLDFVHYYIEIDNLGPDDATGVLLTDLIPAGLVIDPFSVLASQGTFDPVTGIWTVTDGISPTLGYGSSAFLSFLAQVVGTGAITNTVDVNAATYDPDTTNNHAIDIINVPLTPTAIVVNPVSGFKGDIVNLIATLTDTHNNIPVAGKSIQFSVDGNIVGTATTNAQGIATFAYTITQNSGIYTILAQFFQDTIYAGTSNTNDLTVDATPTAITVNPATGFNGHLVNLIATLTDTHNNVALAGKSVQFSVDGNIVGTATTNAQGIATFAYTVTQNIGNYNILAQFLGDSTYAASSNTNNLNVVTYSPPVVTSSDPVFNGMNVAVNKVIKVYFNEAVKFGTNPWIELLTSNGTAVPFTRTISGGNVLSIAPTSLFASNTMYRVILHSNSITDLDGAGLVGPWSTIFTTSPAPTVTSSNPTYNAMNVAVNKVIKVYFSQSVKFGTNPWIEFTTSTGTPIAFTRTISGGNVLSIATTPLMATNTTYRVTLHTNSITNLAGAGIALWSTIFTTTT
jgi:uncharacterized repeat protein (TIGR01451 family)